MAWKSLGRDAVNRNTRHLAWIDRETPHKLLSCRKSPEFHEEIKKYCEECEIQASALIRLLLAREIKSSK